LPNKDTTILSEINDFFASSEKAIQTVFRITGSLKLSDNKFFENQAKNNSYENSDKLLLLLVFPLFKIKNAFEYAQSPYSVTKKLIKGLGKCESQDFDAQIAHSTFCMMQYNILSTVKRFDKYETLGQLFRQTQKETLEIKINERIRLIILEIVAKLAVFLEVDSEMIMEKLLSDNQNVIKLINLKPYMQAG